MSAPPTCVFLDTNVYIIGVDNTESDEGQILKWLGFGQDSSTSVEVIASEELFEQILRVAKRLQNKDWAGEILGRIWQNLNVRYVLLNVEDFARIETLGTVPREDIGVYLTAKAGQAQCFISTNHELIRALAKQTGEFECLTPKDFVTKYLVQPLN